MSKTRDWIIGSIVYYLINERKKLLSKTTTNSRQLTFSWCSKILRTHGKSIRSCVSCYAQLPIFLENQLKASSLALGQFLTRCHESSSRHIRGQVELITNDFKDRYKKIIGNPSQCENPEILFVCYTELFHSKNKNNNNNKKSNSKASELY